jgi:hypothetical protein
METLQTSMLSSIEQAKRLVEEADRLIREHKRQMREGQSDED